MPNSQELDDVEIPRVDGLIEDIKAAFLLPGIVLVLGLINVRWSRIDDESKAYKARIVLTAVLVGFVVFFGTLMIQDRAVLVALWNQSRALYSLLYLACAALLMAGIGTIIRWKLRPELWKRSEPKSTI